jgi:solute:Na+ symporter, SSS family
MLDSLDLIIFLTSIALTMGAGFMASRSQADSEDYFMAGRSIPWWGVAGSVFGTNVSANHLVGMLGIGFSIGFAQSHYELGAILAILLMAYFFLPVYRRLKITTLSEYLSLRFGPSLGLIYSLTLLILILVQLAAAFYIGSRTLGILLEDSLLEVSYGWGIITLMIITAGYTMVGGLRAVVITDVIQSVLLLFSGLLISFLVFNQPEVGGFFQMLAEDKNLPQSDQKMKLFLPSDHPDLPWSGVFTGLMVLHLFFWTNNQYLVQRVLAAKSDSEAKVGLLVGAFLKLLVPFFSVAAGVAAATFFKAKVPGLEVAPDAAFPILVNMIVPAGIGLIGIITAGLLGAIISSLDSMLNSASTLFTIDIFNKYIQKEKNTYQSVLAGRFFLVVLVLVSGLLAFTTYNPQSKANFFLTLSKQGSYFTPGLVAAFLAGIFFRRTSGKAALVCVLSTFPLSLGVELLYDNFLVNYGGITSVLGDNLNFLHRSMIVFILNLFLLFIFADKEANEAYKKYSWQSDGNSSRFLKFGIMMLLSQVIIITLSGIGFVPGILAGFSSFIVAIALGHRYIAKFIGFKNAFFDDRFLATMILGSTCAIFAFFA